ncbi:ATP synthase F1, gamma subunit [Prevotella sp. DNF00663]|uniref:F0F1 ATP synthase subunit gamma n=1 Tax=unclassified Prevotella TaxID=2638335 RepID=UPI0005132F18|nr:MULTISPECIES: F0F1 ATP synthase subunit gamma [unclassified Prevotella]KGI60558.1 ATP F0F1 synthase subunit gamma [Prevotella sp. S7 MS 2]KXB85697.1 ATP synthase F1, gamma subunit [Prevotella sp. DNF00663]
MPSLKEIKTRIASVNSTRKITSAMKMVASSKLHHAQVAIQNMLPYETMLEHILKTFLVSLPDAQSEYDRVHADMKRVALVVFSSNTSLCGGFNANVIKMMQQVVSDYKAQGITDITVYPIGRKVAEKAQKLGLQVAGDFTELADKPSANGCANIATTLARLYQAGEIDKVDMIYHHFKSAGSQILTHKVFLPIDLSTETIGAENDRDLSSNMVTAKAQEYLRKKKESEKKSQEHVAKLNDDYIVEPDLATVLGVLIPKQLNLMMYTALLDSQASEHAARMVAMQTATDNADELLKTLNLQYNKSRQQAITNELLDIVGGSVNN